MTNTIQTLYVYLLLIIQITLDGFNTIHARERSELREGGLEGVVGGTVRFVPLGQN